MTSPCRQQRGRCRTVRAVLHAAATSSNTPVTDPREAESTAAKLMPISPLCASDPSVSDAGRPPVADQDAELDLAALGGTGGRADSGAAEADVQEAAEPGGTVGRAHLHHDVGREAAMLPVADGGSVPVQPARKARAVELDPCARPQPRDATADGAPKRHLLAGQFKLQLNPLAALHHRVWIREKKQRAAGHRMEVARDLIGVLEDVAEHNPFSVPPRGDHCKHTATVRGRGCGSGDAVTRATGRRRG